MKAAPRGVAETLGYSVLRFEQADAIEKLVSGHDVFVSLPTGSGKRAYVLPLVQCAHLNLSLLTQQNQENLQLSPDCPPLAVGVVWGRDYPTSTQKVISVA